MPYTKRQIVRDAFDEVGYADYDFELQAEQLQSALRKLDRMAAVWYVKGIHIGYPFALSPDDASLDTDTNNPIYASAALVANLAVVIAPGLGKTVSPDTKAFALDAYNTLLAVAARERIQEVDMPGDMPAGAGNKRWRSSGSEFLDEPDDPFTPGGTPL